MEDTYTTMTFDCVKAKIEPEPMVVMEYDGTYVMKGTQMEKVKQLKCRDTDIWVCSFPRSGT